MLILDEGDFYSLGKNENCDVWKEEKKGAGTADELLFSQFDYVNPKYSTLKL